MPFSNTFLRHTITFALPGGEVANTAMSWQPSSDLVSLDDATAAAFAARASALWDDIIAFYSAAVAWTGSFLTWVDTDGHSLGRIDSPVDPSPGSGGSNTLPNEVAIVASLRSAFSSRRTRGRMYFPPPATGNIGTTGRYGSGVTEGLAAAVATYAQPLTVGLETYTAVVASATAAGMSTILNIAVGDVPDAQRRRRDNLVEAYSIEPV